MAFRINTNIGAMNAYRNLSMTGNALATSTTRLSTGLRINSGADDPSGLIASESYRAQIGGLTQALANSQDASNFAKTAEGGLSEVNQLLNDARTLAVANGNSTLDATQKQANQTQLNSILASIDRIASNTAFGNKKLLDGSAGTSTTVINSAKIASASIGGKLGSGAVNKDDSIDVQVTTAATHASLTGTKVGLTAGTDVATTTGGSFSINGETFTFAANATAQDVVDAVNQKASVTGVTAAVGTGIVFTSTGYGTDSKVNLVDGSSIVQSSASAASAAGVDAVATVSYTDGTNTYTSTFNKGKGLDLKDADGNSISLTSSGNAVATLTDSVRVAAGASSFQIGGNAGQTASLSLGNFSSSSLSLSGLDITGTDISGALSKLDSAISSVSSARGSIGSFMKNTIDSNVRSLGVARENLSATESAIREVDVAQEMTNYSKLQILQQSGLAMLAQANSQPQAVLSLLRG